MSNTLPLVIGAGILIYIMSGSKKSTSTTSTKQTPAEDSGISFKPGYIVQKGPDGIKCSQLVIKDPSKAFEYANKSIPDKIKKESGVSHMYTAQQAIDEVGRQLFGLGCFDSIVMTDEIAQFMYDLFINSFAGILVLDLYVGGKSKIDSKVLPELKTKFSKKGFGKLKWKTEI